MGIRISLNVPREKRDSVDYRSIQVTERWLYLSLGIDKIRRNRFPREEKWKHEEKFSVPEKKKRTFSRQVKASRSSSMFVRPYDESQNEKQGSRREKTIDQIEIDEKLGRIRRKWVEGLSSLKLRVNFERSFKDDSVKSGGPCDTVD